MGSTSNHPQAGAREDNAPIAEDAHIDPNPVTENMATSIVQAALDSDRTRDLAGEISSSILPGVTASPSSIAHVPIISDSTVSQVFPSSSSSAIEEAARDIKSLAGDPSALQATNVVSAVTNHMTEDIGNRVQAMLVARMRTALFAFASKLPIIGSYFKDIRQMSETNNTLATETTPLLGALRDPKAFATQQAEGLLLRLLSPLLRRLPDVNKLDNVESSDCGFFFKIFVECCFLVKDGGGWLFAHLQEHSLIIAPTVSLGHLSTEDLAASTIGTAVTSVTGYSIVQGFISSLDQVLARAPTHRTSKIACAQAAVVTGIVLFPITQLWTVHSAVILQQLGQSPEVAIPASKFLQIAAAGLPGYAIGEIAKRYLTSQGLSHVHTRFLSATAPLNLVLNYLLVDGPIPALRLGFAGAPLCTVISHNALATMLIIYIVLRVIREQVDYLREQNIIPDELTQTNGLNTGSLTNDNRILEQLQDQSSTSFFTGLGSLIFAGSGGVLKSVSQLWSKDFGGVVASMLGPHVLATQAVALTTATTLYQAPRAMSNVTSDRMKKWLASGDTQRAQIATSVGLLGTFGVVMIISIILLQSATSWGSLFNSDPIVLQNVAMLLPVIAVFQVAHGLGAWIDSSLEALGKTAVYPSFTASMDYFLGIPLGVYLALSRQWGLAGLWIGLTISLTFSCVLSILVLVRTNWNNAVGKKKEREEHVEEQGAEQFMTERAVGDGSTI